MQREVNCESAEDFAVPRGGVDRGHGSWPAGKRRDWRRALTSRKGRETSATDVKHKYCIVLTVRTFYVPATPEASRIRFQRTIPSPS